MVCDSWSPAGAFGAAAVSLRRSPSDIEERSAVGRFIAWPQGWYVVLVEYAFRWTEESKCLQACLPAAYVGQATPVRGPARVLRRRAARRRGGPGLRVLAGRLPCAVPSLPAPGRTRLLCLPAAWATRPAQEVRRARVHHRPAQAELLDLRDQRGPQGAPAPAQPDSGARSAQSRGVRGPAAPLGRGTAGPPASDGRARGRCARVLPGASAVPDPLRGLVPVRPGAHSAPPHRTGPGRAAARLEDDSGHPRAAGGPGPQALVDRAQESIMAFVADEGLALFAGLNAIPKRSYLAE